MNIVEQSIDSDNQDIESDNGNLSTDNSDEDIISTLEQPSTNNIDAKRFLIELQNHYSANADKHLTLLRG